MASQTILRNTMRHAITNSFSRFLFRSFSGESLHELRLGGVKFSTPRHLPAALYQAMEAKLKEESAASSIYFLFVTISFSTKL